MVKICLLEKNKKNVRRIVKMVTRSLIEYEIEMGKVGYGYEHGMDVKIGNLERQISFVKFRFIRNSKIYIVKYCCLVKIIQLFLNNCLGWLSLYYLFQLAPLVVKEFLVKLGGHSRRDSNY
jgi:hypothetical protein